MPLLRQHIAFARLKILLCPLPWPASHCRHILAPVASECTVPLHRQRAPAVGTSQKGIHTGQAQPLPSWKEALETTENQDPRTCKDGGAEDRTSQEAPTACVVPASGAPPWASCPA